MKTKTFDARTEKNLATLDASVVAIARHFMDAAQVYIDENYPGLTIKIISGTRTFAEQNKLYAQGRSKPGKRVTNAPGGFSNHNFGIAFDVGIFRGNAYLGEHGVYGEIGEIGKSLGLEWGGDWKRFVDEPHYQMRPAWAMRFRESEMLAQFRKMKKEGASLFT